MTRFTKCKCCREGFIEEFDDAADFGVGVCFECFDRLYPLLAQAQWRLRGPGEDFPAWTGPISHPDPHAV